MSTSFENPNYAPPSYNAVPTTMPIPKPPSYSESQATVELVRPARSSSSLADADIPTILQRLEETNADQDRESELVAQLRETVDRVETEIKHRRLTRWCRGLAIFVIILSGIVFFVKYLEFF